jgi:cytochrome b
MARNETIRRTSQAASTLVWDPLVRFGHWALVAAFAVAYLSAEEEAGPDPLHVWGGYVVGGIVVLRVLWGFIGSRAMRGSATLSAGPSRPFSI